MLRNPMSISLILNSNFGVTDDEEVDYITPAAAPILSRGIAGG